MEVTTERRDQATNQVRQRLTGPLIQAARTLSQNKATVYGGMKDRKAAFALALASLCANQLQSLSQRTLDEVDWAVLADEFVTRGRPPRDPSNLLNADAEFIGFRATPDFRSRLQRISEGKNLTESAAIRQAVAEWMDQNETKTKE